MQEKRYSAKGCYRLIADNTFSILEILLILSINYQSFTYSLLHTP